MVGSWMGSGRLTGTYCYSLSSPKETRMLKAARLAPDYEKKRRGKSSVDDLAGAT